MKNVAHPNIFPAADDPSVDAGDEAVEVGVNPTVAPTSPWANPSADKLRAGRVTPAPARVETPAPVDVKPKTLPTPKAKPVDKAKPATRADEVIAYLREHGPSSASDLCEAIGITSRAGIVPFIGSALKDGRIVRVAGKYTVGGAGATAEVTAVEYETANAAPAPAPARADRAAVKEAAIAIVAMRKPTVPNPAPVVPPEVVDACRESSTPVKAGRKPEFVVFVDDVQLLSWPDGSVTVQTDSTSVELKRQHFTALSALIELRK